MEDFCHHTSPFQSPELNIPAIYMLYIIASVFATMGNLLVIVTIAHRKALQTRVNLLFCNLALSDFAMGTTVIPLCYVNVLRSSDVECEIRIVRMLLFVWFGSASVWFLATISYERYSHAIKTTRYRVSSNLKKLLLFCVAGWIVSLLLGVASVSGFRPILIHAIFGVQLIVAMVIIAYCYSQIFRKVSKASKASVCPENFTQHDRGTANVNNVQKLDVHRENDEENVGSSKTNGIGNFSAVSNNHVSKSAAVRPLVRVSKEDTGSRTLDEGTGCQLFRAVPLQKETKQESVVSSNIALPATQTCSGSLNNIQAFTNMDGVQMHSLGKENNSSQTIIAKNNMCNKQISVVPERFPFTTGCSEKVTRWKVRSKGSSSFTSRESTANSVADTFRRRQKVTQKRVANTLVLLTIAFIGLWTPFVIVSMIWSVQLELGYNIPFPLDATYQITLILGLFNSGVNPCIYAWRMRDVRRAMIDLICSCSRCDQSVPHREQDNRE